MRNATHLLFIIILFSFPLRTFSQIRSDFMIDPDTTFSTHGAAHAFDANGNWQIIYTVIDTTGDFIKHTILSSQGEIIRLPHLITEMPLMSMKRQVISSKENYTVFGTSWGLPAVGFGITIGIGLLDIQGKSIVPFSPVSDRSLLRSIDVAFVSDTTFMIVFDGFQYPYQHEVVSLQLGTILGELINTPIVVNDDSTTNWYWVQQPLVISRPFTDSVILIWIDNAFEDTYQIFARLYTKDGEPVSSRLLLVDNSNPVDFSWVAADIETNGDFSIVWGGLVDNEWNIFLKRFFADGQTKNEFVKVSESADTGFAPTPDISIDHDSKFIVVWDEKIGLTDKIFAQRFSKEGTTIGQNFKISTAADENIHQQSPSVLLWSDRIYTVWENEPLPGQPGKRFVWGNIQEFNNPVSVKEPDNHLNPHNFQLFQNHPNPFNPSTTIGYRIEKLSKVLLIIYNVKGQKVRTLVNRQHLPGFYKIIWDGQDEKGAFVTSGVYFYQLRVNDKKQNKKMVLVR